MSPELIQKYYNSHTHLKTSLEDEVSVYVSSQDDLLSNTVFNAKTCAGIHPWWPEEITISEIETLKNHISQLAHEGKLWAIGETGLDRLYPEYWDLQVELFYWHLDLAEKFELPLIIHNVRSGSDFLHILKSRKPKTPWLFHDYRGSLELVDSILKLHPQSYFSFGISLDNSQSVRELIRVMPRDKILLETDAQKHLDIHDVYIRACKELELELEALKELMYNNFMGFSRLSH